MTEQERAERFAQAAPPLNQAEQDALNALFPVYIFRRSRTGELWTTCCRRYEVLERCSNDAERAVMAAPHQREAKNRWNDPPKPAVQCPYCGQMAVIKELGRTGGRGNLSSYRRAVALRWDGEALWARAYNCGKHYTDGYSLTGEPSRKLVGVYRFQPGLAEGTSRPWWGDIPFSSMQRQDGPLTKGKWNISSPFNFGAEYGMGYDVVGIDEIQKTPFRYCQAETAEQKFTGFLQFLTACCFYPRQIEMLMKAGMMDVVRDLVARGVKHAAAIRWEEEDPSGAFGLNRQEMKTFLGTSRDIQTLELYKRLKGRASLTECDAWIAKGAEVQKIFQAAKKWSLAPEKLLRYLAGNVGCARYGGLPNLYSALRAWQDYLTAAQALNYPLHRENVLLPKKLSAAHDSATARHRNQLAQERKLEPAEQDRLAAMRYEKRRAELEKKYSFALNGYMIRVPAGKDEILEEGQKLQHCVSGYADRHMDGVLTILFMRREKKPDEPWLTIEMNANHLVQIHGYKNEGIHTKKGRFAPDPREVYRDFLDTWLAWLKAGSKRDKEGKPVLPKKRKEAA